MPSGFSDHIRIQDFKLWDRLTARQAPVSFDLEVTARCHNDCRHCYINVPAGDSSARDKELTLAEIDRIASEAVELGALWCLVTGGEPLLREDFAGIYMTLKRKGLLVSVFTTGNLLRDEHIELLRRYPPRDIEISVYGVTKETYERVTRRPGSFATFERGLDKLLASGVRVRLKAMAMRSNAHELGAIAEFCRARTKDYFRFDPLLHARYDGDAARNAEIRAERLTAEEVVALERGDSERSSAMEKGCDNLILEDPEHLHCDHLFHCGAGNTSFSVSYDGKFRLCSSLSHPDCVYDLRQGTLAEAWRTLVPKVRDMRSRRPEYLERCRSCNISNLCLWCPAHAHLETGELDMPVDYFCDVAHARAAALEAAVRRSDSEF
jgi:radical SAM protein with 4Fe4S-binding SPASM domain